MSFTLLTCLASIGRVFTYHSVSNPSRCQGYTTTNTVISTNYANFTYDPLGQLTSDLAAECEPHTPTIARVMPRK
jgi:hypothetical protein